MAQKTTVNVGNGAIDLWAVSGEVLAEKRWSTTKISGGGSGGFLYEGTGRISSKPITSRVTTHDQFFIQDDDGAETAVELANTNVAIRVGHRVSVIWGIRRGQSRGPYLALYNHNTDSLSQFPGTELIVPRFPLKARAILGIVLTFVHQLGYAGPILGYALIGLAIIGYFTRRSRATKLGRHVATSLLPQLVERNSGGGAIDAAGASSGGAL